MSRLALPRGYPHPGQSKITAIDFSDADNITYTSNCVVATDSAVTYNGNPTTKVTVDNGETTVEVGVNTNVAQFPSGWDYQREFDRMQVTFRGAGFAYVSGLVFYVGDASGYANRINAGPQYLEQTQDLAVLGRWVTDFRHTTFTETGTPAVGPNVQAKIRIVFDGTQPDGTEIWIGEWATFPRSRPNVIIMLDDCWDEQYTYAFPELVAREIPCCFSTITGAIDTAGNMTLAQIQEIAAHSSGNYDIVNHSTNGDNLTDIGASALVANLAEARNQIQDWVGQDTGAFVVYPNGQHDATVMAALINSGYKAAREVGAVNRTWPTTPFMEAGATIPRHKRFALPASTQLSSTYDLATVKGHLDNGISRGGTFVIMGHKFDAAAGVDQWAEADFEALLDYIVQKRADGLIDTLSLSQWYAGLQGSRIDATAGRIVG